MRKILLLIFVFLFCFGCPVLGNGDKIVDEAGVLSNSEVTRLDEMIVEYNESTNYDLVIYLTSGSTYFDQYGEDEAITRLADDFFDDNGYGFGLKKSGLILCFDLYYGTYTVTTRGDCINEYSDVELEQIYDRVTPYFSDGDYYDGLVCFIDGAKDLAVSDDSFGGKIMSAIKPALIGALIVTFVVYLILSSKLKSANGQQLADDYMTKARVNVARSGQIFLYKTTTRTKIEGGSKTHESSSGVRHGGGGGHRV